MRADYPMLFFLPGFMVGQYSAFLHGSAFAHSESTVVFVVIALVVLLALKQQIWIASFICGALSVFAWPFPSLPSWVRSEGSYVMTIDERPRFPHPESLQISGVLSHPDGVQGPRVLCSAIDLPWRNLSKVKKGDTVLIQATFAPLQTSLNLFSYEATLMRHGYAAKCRVLFGEILEIADPTVAERLRSRLVRGVRDHFGNGELAGLMISMSIGGRDTLSARTEDAFRRTGLTHLLVVSGYQVTLIYRLLFLFLLWLGSRSYRIAARFPVPAGACIAAFCFAAFYVVLAGLDGSVLRAQLALIFLVVSRFFERGGGLLNGIFVSFFLISIIWPGSFLEPSVELTYGALLGISVGAQKDGLSNFKEYLRVSLCASLFTAIVVCAWFDQFSLIGFFLNPLIAPIASVIGCNFSLCAMIFHTLGIDSTGFLLSGCGFILTQFRDVVLWCAELPFSAVELAGIGKIAALACLGIVAYGLVGQRVLEYQLLNNVYRETVSRENVRGERDRNSKISKR